MQAQVYLSNHKYNTNIGMTHVYKNHVNNLSYYNDLHW